MSTLSQRAISRAIHKGLTEREMVLLWGDKPDGKTHIFYSLLEKYSIGIDDDGKIRHSIKANHAENFRCEFLEGIEIPFRSDRIEPDYIKKHILQCYGEKSNNIRQLDLRTKYIALLRDLERNRIMPVIAVDGIEMLPSRAYTSIKMLNEQGSKGKKMGPAFLLSGSFSKRKLPPNFWLHCKEIQAGKVTAAEMEEFIEQIAPDKSRHFNQASLRKLAECDSTLEMAAKIRVALEYRAEQVLDKVTDDVITRIDDRQRYVRTKIGMVGSFKESKFAKAA